MPKGAVTQKNLGATPGNPLHVDIGGATLTGGTFQNESEGTTGAAAPAKSDQSGGVDAEGNLQAFTVDDAGRQKVTDDLVLAAIAALQAAFDARDLATSAAQLPDGHNVTVTNPTADPETGLAKDATLDAIGALLTTIRDQQQTDALTDAEMRAAAVTTKGPGTWAPYGAGILTSAGSVSATGLCTGIRVLNSGLATASFNINGGATITIPSGFVENIGPEGSLVDPVVNWVSGTLSVLVTVDA